MSQYSFFHKIVLNFFSTTPSRSTISRSCMPLSTTSRIFDISNWLFDILQVTFDDDVNSSSTWASAWLPLVWIFDLRLILSVKLTTLKRWSTLLRLSLSYLNELLSYFLHFCPFYLEDSWQSFYLVSWSDLFLLWNLWEMMISIIFQINYLTTKNLFEILWAII